MFSEAMLMPTMLMSRHCTQGTDRRDRQKRDRQKRETDRRETDKRERQTEERQTLHGLLVSPLLSKQLTLITILSFVRLMLLQFTFVHLIGVCSHLT